VEKLLLVAAIVLLATAASGKTGLPDFVVPDCLGVNIHFVGPEHKQVDQIADAGFRYIRMDYIWNHVEKERSDYNFKPYDELLDALKKRDIRPLFILCYGNVHYDEGNAPRTDEGRKAFVEYARAAAEHFKGEGILWELWNEPNLAQFWRPAPSVEDYIKLAKLVYPALKKADPDCTVLAPALAGWDFGYFEQACKLGLLENTDVVSLHAYGAAKPEDAAQYYANIRAIIGKHAPKGREIPIVSGEWGYPAVKGFTVEKQGEFIVRQFLTNLMNDVRLSIWYDWHDDGPDPDENEHHFGTVYLDYKPKPAYFAVQTLTRELAGYAFAARLTTGSSDDYLALFRKGDDYRLAAWTAGRPHKVKLPVDVEQFEVVSLEGVRSPLQATGGEIDLELSGAVQYIEPLQPSKRWAMEAAWKVSARTVWNDGRLEAEVVSESTGGDAVLKVSGNGLAAQQTSAEGRPDRPVTLRTRGRYVHNGDSTPNVTVSLTVKGTDRPMVRVIPVDPSACPRVEVLPPAEGELLIEVSRPESDYPAEFAGKLLIGSLSGVKLEERAVEVDLPEGSDRAVYRFRMAQEPALVYSFSCRLVDSDGGDVVRIPTRRYTIVETFADGKVGDVVNEYALELDGDSQVPAKADLIYAKAPAGGPGPVCAKLDYEFEQGWRFVRVSPRPMIRIPEKPLYAKLWVKGDDGDGLSRLRLLDSDGQTFQPDYGRLNFAEWRCLTADLTCASAGHWGGKNDGVVRYPVSWDTLFLLDNAGGRKSNGTVHLGSLMVCYD